MTEDIELSTDNLLPADVTAWLKVHGWALQGSLANIAERWGRGESTSVVVPLLPNAPDFQLRWDEMLARLSQVTDTDRAGVLLAVSKTGSDIAEFKAAGRIDDSLPLGDAATLIESVRRAMQASANSALQPRSYYGHSLPDAARHHARNVRMGQTRRGSYVVPVISRLPILQPDDDEDAVLFGDVAFQPFARRAMLKLAEGLGAIRSLTHGGAEPRRQQITEAIPEGVSSELCDAVVNTLEAESIHDLSVGFSWAERLPMSAPPAGIKLESAAAPLIRKVGAFLKGEPIVGRQTFTGYVKRLDRGEEDDLGRITLRALVDDKARNITMDLNDEAYHVAGGANTDRRVVSVTGKLVRDPGRALRFDEVSDFRLLEELPSLLDD